MPSRPVPRRMFTSTVSARSSAVCPVRTSGSSSAYRAARARASRLGPWAISARTLRKDAPSRAAAASPPLPSAPEPAPGPWSTCTAVTAQPATHASTRSARESAPPDTAHVRARPGGGNVHRASNPAIRGSGDGDTDPTQPQLGLADLPQRRELFGAVPASVDGTRSGRGLDGVDETLALLVLSHLGFESEQSLQDPGGSRCRLPSLPEHTGEATRTRNEIATRPRHRHVAVALEERHKAPDTAQHLTLRGRGQHRGEASVGEGITTRAQRADHPFQTGGQHLRIDIERLNELGHERQAVGPQPRDPRELGPAGDLVQGEPQP